MKRIFIFFFFVVLLISSNNLYAEIDCVAEPYHPECDEGGGGPDAPIDSGVGLLIGAATIYAFKKIRYK